MNNARVFSVDYRLAPEAPFPRGLRDAVEAYYHLIESGVPAANIIVSGEYSRLFTIQIHLTRSRY